MSEASTPRSDGKKRRKRKKRKRRDDSDSADSASDGASDGASSGDESSGSGSGSDRPSSEELDKRAAALAASLSRDAAAKYNKLRLAIALEHHLMGKRVSSRCALLPLRKPKTCWPSLGMRGALRKRQKQVEWLNKWEAEHLGPAEARWHLLMQLKPISDVQAAPSWRTRSPK